MAFEAFTQVNSRARGTVAVTILKQGNLSINSTTMKLLKEKGCGYVVMMFDRDTNQIGLKSAQKEDQGAYMVREQKGNGQVSALAFLKHYEIPFKEASKNYSARWNEELGMLVIQL